MCNIKREKEIYFRRQIYRLNKIKKERELNSKRYSILISKNIVVLKLIEVKNNKVQKELKNSKIKIIDIKDNDISEEEQWEINNKILLE